MIYVISAANGTVMGILFHIANIQPTDASYWVFLVASVILNIAAYEQGKNK